jgi:4-phytase/acid phosphatase
LGQELELEQIVLLSRHGVRSPTQPLSELDRLVTTPWARWPVAPGELTPRGANLMRLMGGYYRAIYARRGLLSPDGCPDPGTVMAWADVDQRTRATAKSLTGFSLAADCESNIKTTSTLPTLCSTQPKQAFAGSTFNALGQRCLVGLVVSSGQF